MKVVYELGRAGYIETVRGQNGGMRLAKDPVTINLGEVVRHTEPDMNLVECFGTGGTCRLTPSCVLRSAFQKGLAAFLAELDRYTLADLVAPEKELAALLSLSPAPAIAARSAPRGGRGRPRPRAQR
jgi:Rrf2 family nitric oxide-sensitive transcriptional repressor